MNILGRMFLYLFVFCFFLVICPDDPSAIEGILMTFGVVSGLLFVFFGGDK